MKCNFTGTWAHIICFNFKCISCVLDLYYVLCIDVCLRRWQCTCDAFIQIYLFTLFFNLFFLFYDSICIHTFFYLFIFLIIFSRRECSCVVRLWLIRFWEDLHCTFIRTVIPLLCHDQSIIICNNISKLALMYSSILI